MSKGVTFTVDAAKRITKVVKRVEQMPQQMGGMNSPSIPHGTRFWAYLLSGVAFTANDYRYSFIKVIPDPTDEKDGWKFDLDVQGYDCVRDPTGYNELPGQTVAEIEFIGYDKDGEPQYWICSPPKHDEYEKIPPVHSHLNNNDGGFAFACYAPGTAYPQKPFAV